MAEWKWRKNKKKSIAHILCVSALNCIKKEEKSKKTFHGMRNSF